MRRAELSPAALGSLLLHGGLAAAFLVSWGARDIKVGSVTPVTIVSSAPAADPPPAIEAPDTQEALAETPVPEAPPNPVPPAPEPTPTPPAPTPKAARPVEKAPTPTPKKPTPKAAESSLDLDALAASLSKSARPASNRPSPAPKGPSRPATAPDARATTGVSPAAGVALSGLAEELQRRWNPNCEVEGGRDVLVRATFEIGAGGGVVGAVATSLEGPNTPVALAAAERARRAVLAAQPFRSLPRELYGQRVRVNFNAREACAS